MPSKKKDPNQFKSIGNLAFYDGWHPNYFYFNTLLRYAQSMDTKIHGAWDSRAAGDKAAEAIADAYSKFNFNGLTQEDSIIELSHKFEYIINFLTAAYNMEVANELLYFKQKFKQLNEHFTPEEKKLVAPLKRLLEIFIKNNKNASSFTDNDYYDFITCINVLLQGLESTQAIAAHEKERLDSLDATMNKLIESRRNQAAGVKKGEHLSTAEQIAAAERAEARLRKQYKSEYLAHGSLTGTHIVERKARGQHGKILTDDKGNPIMKKMEVYNVFGGAQFKKNIKGTVDVVLAKWAKDTLSHVVKDKQTIMSLIEKIQPNYPTNGNFYALVPHLRQILILAIQQYGIDNLSQALTEKVTKATAQQVVKKLLTQDQKIFDTVQQHDIVGLDDTYGLKGQHLDLFKQANTTAAMANNKSTELYNKMSRVLTKLRDKKELDENETLLIKVYKTTNSPDAMLELITMVEELETMQKELDQIQTKYNKLVEEGVKELKQTISVHTTAGDVSIKVSIVNGEVTVDMTALKAALRNNPAFQSLAFGKFNPNSIKSAIITIKGRISQQLKSELINSANTAIAQGAFGLSTNELLGQMRQGLEQLEISITGPPLSEVLTAIQIKQKGNDIVVDWNAKLMGKNDVVSITIKSSDIVESIKLDLNELPRQLLEQQFLPAINKARKDFLTEYQLAINEAVGQMTRTNQMDKYSALIPIFQQDLGELEKADTKLGQAYRDIQSEWRKIRSMLLKQGIEREKIVKAQSYFLNTLRNSIMESTTVKTYNNYQNNIGFKGGSIGTNLSQQLTRLEDIFKSAGLEMPKEEKEWLRFAILNCSPLSIMDESNKGMIESYLGSIAAFALFDEGGVEAKIVNDFMNDVQRGTNKKTNPGIFHLYRTDTLLVPGSFILKKTLDSLKQDVLPQLMKIPTLAKTGAGIEIINGASESFIPNRPITTTANPKTNAWSLTGKAIEKTVKLKILFLAGFLDIVNGINSRMANIAIPS